MAAAPALIQSEAAGAAACTTPAALPTTPGFAMLMPTSACASTTSTAAAAGLRAAAHTSSAIGSYNHTPTPNPAEDLPPGSGPIMPSTTIYYVYWLPTGFHFGASGADDVAYESLLERFAHDIGGSQYHNLATQYSGTNGTVSNNVSFGGSWTDTTPYPHAGTTGDPLTDGDVQGAVAAAVAANGWTEDLTHIVAVFTANGIQECGGGECTYTVPGFCAYHDHFNDGGNDAIYAFMGYDNFTHVAGYTCVAGQTGNDTDPNRGSYPNNNVSADAEINTFSHELTEAETDPHPNATWTGPNGEIGDACNFNFAPRNDSGADVYLNGDPYIVQQEYSNNAHTCGIDLPTNGFCPGAVSGVCAPTTSYTKSVDVANPRVDSTINYTLSLDNTSDTAAESNLAVNDTLPSGYQVTNLSAPGATTSSSTSTSISVAYDTLPVHQSRSIVVTASVPETAGSSATNCGDLTGQDLLGTALPDQTSTPCATTVPIKIPTIVTYTGATSGDFNDPATVSATLTDDALNPLAGKQLDFSLNGAESCSGVTDGAGVASCTITPGEAAGPYTVTAGFNDSSDPKYAVSSTTAGFTVTLEETTTTYTGPTVILKGGAGVTLSGLLLEDGLTPIAGRTLTLSLGSQSCTTAPTAADGTASCTITFSGALGPEPLVASFAGDAYYQPSQDSSKTAVVFAFPSRGAFTLGDKTVAAAGPLNALLFWGDVWSSTNSLSGGTAPSSFKGFAGTVSLPTATPPGSCAGSFSTLPGNSPPPTAGVPTYMGVIVTSKVVKAGRGITGTQTHIVVMKVNPGYAPDPADLGTGTIVAQYC